MTTNNDDQPDPLGKLMSGVRQYLVELPRDVFDAVWADLVVLMRAAVGVGRIDTVADEHTPEAMGRDPRVDRHGGEVYVYRRTGQPCLVCGTEIRTTMLEGRTMSILLIPKPNKD